MFKKVYFLVLCARYQTGKKNIEIKMVTFKTQLGPHIYIYLSAHSAVQQNSLEEKIVVRTYVTHFFLVLLSIGNPNLYLLFNFYWGRIRKKVFSMATSIYFFILYMRYGAKNQKKNDLNSRGPITYLVYIVFILCYNFKLVYTIKKYFVWIFLQNYQYCG